MHSCCCCYKILGHRSQSSNPQKSILLKANEEQTQLLSVIKEKKNKVFFCCNAKIQTDTVCAFWWVSWKNSKGAAYLQLADCYCNIKHPRIILSTLLMGPTWNAGVYFRKVGHHRATTVMQVRHLEVMKSLMQTWEPVACSLNYMFPIWLSVWQVVAAKLCKLYKHI